MRRPVLKSVRARLVALVLLALVPALVLVQFSGMERRQAAAESTKNEALQLAHVIAADQTQLVDSSRQLLVALAQALVLEDSDPAGCPSWLADTPDQSPEISSLAIASPEGDVSCSAPTVTQPLNLASYDWYRQVVETRGFVVGGYQPGPISGRLSLVLAYPVLDALGGVRAILVMEIGLEWLDQWAAEASLPAGSVLAILDHTGTTVAGRPQGDASVGQGSLPPSLLDQISASSGNGVVEVSGLDGVLRFYALAALTRARSVADDGTYIAVGIPRAAVLRDANWRMVRDVALLMLVAVLAVEAAWFGGGRFLARPVQAMVTAAERLAAGDLSAHTGLTEDLGEMGRLASAFDHMAASLRQRQVDRDQAEQALWQQLARTSLLNQIARAISERQDLTSILRVVVTRLKDELGVDWSCAATYDAGRGAFLVAASSAEDRPSASQLALPEGTVVYARQTWLDETLRGRPVCLDDMSATDVPLVQHLASLGMRSIAVVPLSVEGHVLGALFIARGDATGFETADMDFLRSLCEHVAVAAHQAQLYEDLRGAYDELRQTQEAAMEQERLRALGAMASGIAHDINNAISPAVIFAEMLKREPSLDARGRDMAEDILTSCSDVAQMVARLREFYRKADPDEVLLPVDLNEAVRQAMDLSRPRWRDMPQSSGVLISTQTDLQPDLPPVMGVEGEIREALTNLVLNAVDAMPDGGLLAIRTCVDGRVGKEGPVYAVLEVSDTGIGMDEETRRRCLEPFFTTKGGGGTGLGLAVVHGTVERHRGHIEIDSAPGQGTCIRLLFPARAHTEPSEAAPAVAGPLAPMRILHVDDEPVLRRAVTAMLESEGHTVEVAECGQAGIDQFRAALERGEPFDVVITDLGMPHVSGRDVARAVKFESPTTEVVMLTGWGKWLEEETDLPSHVDWVLSKPPRAEELRRALVGAATARLRRAGLDRRSDPGLDGDAYPGPCQQFGSAPDPGPALIGNDLDQSSGRG